MKTEVKSPSSAKSRRGLGMFLPEAPPADAPKHPECPLFPALRSGPAAVSEASRKKQIPGNRLKGRLNRMTWAVSMALLSCFSQIAESKAEFALKGAQIGEWTMDYDAALDLAKKEDLRILMKFTTEGCSNCKVMERNIFSKKAFIDFGSKNLVLVWLDYSKKYRKTPEEYLLRNDILVEVYNIRGYPTCVYLESDGETVIGKLGNRGDAEGFVHRLQTLEIFTPKGMERYIKDHPPKGGCLRECVHGSGKVRERTQRLGELRTSEE
jgi:thioredoxin-related protein